VWKKQRRNFQQNGRCPISVREKFPARGQASRKNEMVSSWTYFADFKTVRNWEANDFRADLIKTGPSIHFFKCYDIKNICYFRVRSPTRRSGNIRRKFLTEFKPSSDLPKAHAVNSRRIETRATAPKKASSKSSSEQPNKK
jgi:hypothetical protein